MTYTPEQLNYFKFSTVVVDEFPDALRQVFAFMWDTLVATAPGVPKWDNSVTVLNMLLAKEGGVKKVPSLNKSYKEWDCTALFKATLFAQTYARPDGAGGLGTMDKLYVRPRGLPAGTFHPSVISPTGNNAETYALALDQLRLLRNKLCHQNNTRNIDKVTFDHYILLTKEALTALGQNTSKIYYIANLGEEDFPTRRLQQLEQELKKEKDAAIKFKQIEDHLTEVEAQVKVVDSDVKHVKSDVKDVKSDVTDVKTQVEGVGSDVKDVKSDVTDVKKQVEDVVSDVNDVKSDVTDVKTQVEDVGSDVKDVKTQVEDVGSDVKDVISDVTDVKTQVEDVGSDVKDVKSDVTDVETQVEDVGSDVKDVKSDVTDVKTQVEDVGSDVKNVKSDVTDVKTQVEDVGSDVKDVKSDVTDVKTQVEDVGSDVKDVKSDVTDVKTQVEDVGSDVKDVKSDVTDVKTQVEDVGSDVKDVKSDVTDVKTQVEDVGSDVKDVKSDVTHVKTQVEDVGSDVKDVKSDVTDVKTQVEDVGSDVKDVKSDVTHVKTQVEDVGSDVKDVKSDVTDVKTQVEDVGSDVKDVKSDVTDVKTQVEDVGSDVKDVKSDVTHVKTQVEDVGSDVKDVKSDVTDVKTQVEDVGSDVKDVKSDVTDVKTQVEDVGSDVKDVKSDVTHVKTQVEDVGSDVKDVKSDVTDVKTQVEDVGSDVKDVKSDVTDVKTQVEDVGSDVKDVKSDVTHVKTQVEDVGSDVKDVKSDVTDVKTQVEDVGSDVKDVKSDVTHVKTQVEDVGSDVKDVKSDVTDVKTQVEDVGSDVKDVKSDVTHVKTQVEDVGSDVKDVKSDVTDVKTQVEDVGSDVKDVKSDVTDVKTQVEDVGSDVKDVKSDVTDVKTQVEDVGSDVKDVKSDVTDVKTQVEDVGSDVKVVKSDVTDVKTQVEDVGSYIKDVKTQVEDVGSEVKGLKADVNDIKKAIQVENMKAPVPCLPDKIPHFVGRHKECESILNHLTNGDIRLVDVWGPPGFGKTSVAINVAHHLKEMDIPVYFTSVRGMKSKDELVSKLLSIFADAKQAFYVSPSHWLIQCLQQLENPFVLILDNADDLLESGDSKLKEDVLGFTEEILTQCSQIKLLFTTRESLDYLSHKLSIHQERVGVLDGVSSDNLVKSLLPDISEEDCSFIVMECGQVPLAMRLMCSIMREERASAAELSEELKESPLVDVLDSKSFADDARLKTIINSSFKRLTGQERDALVSLAVFPSNFGVEEAKAVLALKPFRQAKKVIQSLTRKSLVDCNDDFGSFTIHSLLRSFVEERRLANQAIQATFSAARRRFYDYHITSFAEANEKFLTGHSNDAFKVFHDQRESILLSLENGEKDDALYSKVVDALSKAELFFYAVLPNEGLLVDRLYNTAVAEAKKRRCREDECNLLAAKSFGTLGGFYKDRQNWDQSLEASSSDSNSWTGKRLCYFGILQLLSGKTDDGTSSLRTSVDRLNSHLCDEKVLRVLACHVLAVCYSKKGDKQNASQFETFCKNECKSASFCSAVRNLFLQESSSAGKLTDLASVVEKDVFFFVVVAELLPGLYKELKFGKQAETELSTMTRHLVGLHQVLLALFDKGIINVRVQEACCNALYSLRCFQEAAQGFQMIIDKLEKTVGNGHELLARNYQFRGLALKELKEHEAALCCLKKALGLRRQIVQENLDATCSNNIIKETIITLHNCLKILQILGVTFGSDQADDFKVICQEIKSALKSMEKISGVDFAEIATNYNLLGNCYLIMDDHNGAHESCQQGLKIIEEHVAADSVDKAVCLQGIGSVHLKMQGNTETQKAFQGALDLMKSLGLEDCSSVATIYHALGANHFILGEFSEAVDAHLQGLQLRKKHLGDHLLTAQSFTLTGSAYYQMGEHEAARECLQNAADLLSTFHGDCLDTASAFNLLSVVYLSMENYREALEFCKEGMNIRLKLLGDHVETAESFHLFGLTCFKMCDLEEAGRSFQRASALRSKLLGDHVETAESFHLFGLTCFKMSDFKEAVGSFRRASALRSKLLGDHLDTALSYHCLGEAQMSMGDYSGACESLQKALRIREKELGSHLDTTATLKLYEDAYTGYLIKLSLN